MRLQVRIDLIELILAEDEEVLEGIVDHPKGGFTPEMIACCSGEDIARKESHRSAGEEEG